jgi:hypothetical protein
MTCQEIRENLVTYLKQKLSNEKSATIKQHLRECTDCANELENLRHVDSALEQLPPIEPSPSFDARLFARLDGPDARGGKNWFNWGRIRLVDRYGWSLVVLLIATVGIWIGIRHQQYRELNTLQKVIDVQNRYLGPSTEKGNTRSEPSVQTKGPTTKISPGQKDDETPITAARDEEIPEADKVLLENLDLLQDYEILNSFDVPDHRNTVKQRITD